MKIKLWLNYVLINYKSVSLYKECYFLLGYVLKKNILWIEKNYNFFIKSYKLNILNSFLYRRLKGEPINYIIGNCYFYNIKVKIYSDVFIPRMDTELMVDYAIKKVMSEKLVNVLDLGCGSGCIGLSIAKNCTDSRVFCLDNSKLCIDLCFLNITLLKLCNVFLIKNNWFLNLDRNKYVFDLIISNPPYIWINDFFLSNGDLRYENLYNLISECKGLLDIWYIIKKSFFYLNNYGWLIIEHSDLNSYKITCLYNLYYVNVKTYKDLNGCKRFTVGQKII